MRTLNVLLALSVVGGFAAPAQAAETITYTYDALGRLVAVVHSGTVNSGVQVIYQYDAKGNRVAVVVTGAPQ